MSLITVDSKKCKRDGMCAAVCPLGVLDQDQQGLPRAARAEWCIACGHCVAVCPRGALSNAQVDAKDMLTMPQHLPDAQDMRGLMLSRRSVRAYKDDPVAQEAVAALLDTVRHAPTAVNSQKVSWVACADPGKTRRAASLTMEWLRGAGIYPALVEAWDQGREVILRGAPAFVVALAPVEYPWGIVDCTIALTYFELAAASAGLGACWAGLLTRAAQSHPPLAALLGVPEGQAPQGALMLGHPKFKYSLIPPRNPARVAWL